MFTEGGLLEALDFGGSLGSIEGRITQIVTGSIEAVGLDNAFGSILG